MAKSYQTSTHLYAQSKQYLAGGVASSLRAAMKPTPLFAESGSGPYIRDVDGNTYIDYLLAYGPLILGHAHPALTEGVTKAMRRGTTYGLQHTGEIELAKLLTEILPCADRVVFSGSGTEAVMLALRLARAHTGKRKVVRFHGHYHGWSDAIFTAFPSSDMRQSGKANAPSEAVQPGTGGQSELSLQEVILLPWNDEQALEAALRDNKDDIAAVITEPIMCNSGCIQPKEGYLQRMRMLTEELGIVMIMDEVITGFRLGLGGAHGKFGITPDLVTIGKAMGGGIAISGVAGKADIMELIENGTVSHLGTLNGNCVATAAALTILHELGKEGGAIFDQMEQRTNKLAKGIRSVLAHHSIPGIINQAGPVLHMMFTEQEKVEDFASFNKRDAGKYTRFAEFMLEEGVLIRSNGLWYLSTEHGDTEIDATLEAVERAVARI
jgi:glutamate-1-semialdehyde 2,1-aminomutase